MSPPSVMTFFFLREREREQVTETFCFQVCFFPLLFSQRYFYQQCHPSFVCANERIPGQFSHALKTRAKEKVSIKTSVLSRGGLDITL